MAKRKPRLIEMVLALNESDLPLRKIGASPASAIDPVVDARQQQMQMEQMIEAISKYGDYGKALKRATTMQEVGSQLAQIAELAEQAVMNEADDSFDQHTLKRNMQEIKKYAGSFAKLAQEADMINQRMSAYYEDMGRILERYFELPQGSDEQPIPDGRVHTEVPPAGGDSVDKYTASDDTVQMDEAALEDDELELSPERPVKEDPSPNGNETDHTAEKASEGGDVVHKSPKLDQLTLRAILSVHSRLKKNNPEMAKRFAKLSPHQMEKVVWRLVR